MADTFVFSGPKDADLDAKYARPSAKRRRLEKGKRSVVSGKMEFVHEHACMARFAEPVFYAAGLLPPFFQHGSVSSPPCDATRLAHRTGSIATSEHLPDYPGRDGPSSSSDHVFGASQYPKPGSIHATFDADGEHRLPALPDGTQISNSLSALQTSRAPVPRLSQRCSCESLHSNGNGSTNAMTGEFWFGQGDSLYDIGNLDDDYEYTILSDMVYTAWSVDDHRHTRDVSEFAEELAAAEGGNDAVSDLQAALAERSDNHLVRRQDLSAAVDLQGLAWDMSRSQSARDNALSMRAFMRPSNIDRAWLDQEVDALLSARSRSERLYRFRHFNGRGTTRPAFGHYELRHMLASDGRQIYYANNSRIMQSTPAVPGAGNVALDLTKHRLTSEPMKITCLATSSGQRDNVLVAGGFEGEYAMMNLDSEDPQTEGLVTIERNGLITHVHTFAHRTSGALQAAFCSNDNHLRILDVATQRSTSQFEYDTPTNCAATSPDGRLRLLVGDSADAKITDAATGETLIQLAGHTDDVFACAWSPKHHLIATGSADGKALLWDPRNWSRPLESLSSIVTCPRSLQFSADGGVMFAAEDEDVVSVFDTRDWAVRQDIRFFGTVAGVALLNGGEELVVGNGDRTVGGLMTFARTQTATYAESIGGRRDAMERKRRQNAKRMRHERHEMVAELNV